MGETMSNKFETLYDKYTHEAIEKCLEKNKVPEYTKNLYNSKLKYQKEYTLEEFAAITAGLSIARYGLGEKCQFEIMQEKYPEIQRLCGANSLRILKNHGRLEIEKCKKKESNTNTKSLDGFIPTKGVFLFCKSIDCGNYSTNVGGGQQDNVSAEIQNLFELTKGKEVYYNNKAIAIWIVVDGRGAKVIIDNFTAQLNGSKVIKKICESDKV